MSATNLTLLSRLYLDHLAVMNYSQRTIEQRDMILNHFIDWCSERGLDKANDITKPILERYRRYLHHSRDKRGNPMSARNQAVRLTPLRMMFRWATQQNYLLYNPASELEMPRTGRPLPKEPLSAEEAEQILAVPDIHTGEGLRNRAILEVLYSTGIRRMEIANLAKVDVHPGRGVLAVRQGKGKKDRFVPISERAMQWLQHYLIDVRPDWVITPEPPQVFLEPSGQPIPLDRYSRIVGKLIKQAGIDKSGGCHLFRHTLATLMLDNGADLRYVQEMLGHAVISTTEIYTHVSIAKLKRIHSMTHPSVQRGKHKENALEATQDEVLAMLETEKEEES